MTSTLKKRILVFSNWRFSSVFLIAFVTGCGETSVPMSGTEAVGSSGAGMVNSPVQSAEQTPAPTVAPEPEPAPEQAPAPPVAPEPAAEQSPAPTVAPEPAAEQSPAPTVAPEPASEQTPAPTVAPEPASEQTPAPTVAPEQAPAPPVAPEPVAEQTPAPTVAPEPVAEQTPAPTVAPEAVAEQAPAPTVAPEPVAEQAPPPLPTPQAAEPDSGLQPMNDEGSAPAGNATSSLRTVPDQLDNLYRYNVNSISDLVTYRGPDGTLQQVFSYWSDDRRLHVTQRSFPDGEFSTPIDVHNAVHGGNDALEYDSHNSSAIGIAANGVMFVAGNHHSSVLNMAKTTSAFDIGSFSHMLPGQMVASSEVDRVTYPSFFNHGRFLYFSYREQEVGQGAPRFRWLINRYDHDRDEWQRAVQFNTGIDLRLYVSSVAVPADGSSMHVFATWRDDSAGGGVDSQRDYFHLYSTDGTSWKIKNSAKTISASQHLWYDNGERSLPGYTGIQLSRAEKIWETPNDSGPRSAGDVAVDSNGNPHSLVKNFSGSLFHHYWDGVWKSTQLAGAASQSLDMVACPSQMGALLHDRDRIRYRSLDPAHPSYNSPVLLAQGFTNSDFTVSIDKEAIRLGYVSFLLTSSSHFSPNNHGNVRANPQPAWVATYHCSQLDNATAMTRSN